MIVLKHLAREFKLEPYKLRQILRKQFGRSTKEGTYRKWKWENDNDPELLMIRNFLRTGECTSPSPVVSTPDTSTPQRPTPLPRASGSETNGEFHPMMTETPCSKQRKVIH